MTHGENDGRPRDAAEKVSRLMQSIGRGPEKQISSEELQKLKSAASRLDQMLKASDDANAEGLRNAAARLDKLLSDISAGKDIASKLKKRKEPQNTE